MVIACHKHLSEAILCDVSDEANIVDGLDFLMVTNRNGEQQFIVFAAVECAGGHVHVEFFCHYRSLIVDGDLLLEDTASHMALLADVHQFTRQSIADIHHSCGAYAGSTELLDNIAACLGAQLALEQIFFAGKVGLELSQTLQCLFIAFALGFVNL